MADYFWNQIVPVLILVAALCGIGAFLNVFWLRPAIEGEKARLDTQAGRRAIKARLSAAPGFAGYRRSIRRLNARLRRWFGRPLTWRAFDRCLLIAFAYPMLTFLIGWIVSGQGAIGATVLIEDSGTFVSRFFLGTTIALTGLAFGYYLFRLYDIQSWLQVQLTRLPGLHDSSINPVKMNLTGLVAFAFAGAGALAGVVAVAGALAVAGVVAGAGALSGVVAVAGALALAGVGAVAGAGALAVAVAGAFALALAGVGAGAGAVTSSDVALTILIFLVALPIVNAAADLLSWAATRFFLHRVTAITATGIRRAASLAADLLLDIVVGIACLFVLAALLANVMELAGLAFDRLGWAAVRWQTFLAEAITDPWGGGLFVWLMLATTLAPTMLHLAVGVWGVALAIRPRSRTLADQITIGRKGQPWEQVGAQGRDPELQQQIARHVVHRRLWYVPAGLVVTALLVALALATLQGASRIGLGLGHVAFCSTAWSHGYCELLWFRDADTPVPAELLPEPAKIFDV